LLQLAVSLALGDNAEYHESLDIDTLPFFRIFRKKQLPQIGSKK
jgi:hypothetical protein